MKPKPRLGKASAWLPYRAQRSHQDWKRAQIDSNLVSLVEVLNSFRGLWTIECCGGHREQGTEGEWSIQMRIKRDDYGYFALEFLAWVFGGGNHMHAELTPHSSPPYLNFPGETLYFSLNGWPGEPCSVPDCEGPRDPDAIAKHLHDLKERFYITPGKATRLGMLTRRYFPLFARRRRVRAPVSVSAAASAGRAT